MEITRISMFSGKTRTLELPVTQEQLDQYYKGRALLQYAFPQLLMEYMLNALAQVIFFPT